MTGVSIHASVKDATQSLLHAFSISSFNPRICKRCDHHHAPTGQVRYCFNPRICKRCDKALDFDRIYIRVSIHASVKDATHEMLQLC